MTAVASGSNVVDGRWLHWLDRIRAYDPSSWRRTDRLTWFLWLPIWFGVGIAGYFSLQEEPPLWPAGVALAVATAMLLLGLRHGRLRQPALVLLFLVAGFAVAQWRTHSVAAPVLLRQIGPLLLRGEVLVSETRPSGFRLTVRPSHSLGREGVWLKRVRFTVRGGTRPRAGEQVKVLAVLMPPSAPLRPGAFDFSRMAWFEQLGAVGYAVGRLEVTGTPSATISGSAVERLREEISDRIRAVLPGSSGAVTAALLTGDRAGIPEEALRDMRDAGLAHLLAISGLHVGLIAGCLFFALRLGLAAIPSIALRYPTKKIAAVVSLAGAIGYLVLTGVTVPTQRAVIMVGFAVVAVLLNRTPISMRVLACAALLVLMLTPESLLSPSFQMSFAAVAALIAVYDLASPRLADWRRDGGMGRRVLIYFVAVGLTTLVAGLATAPFAAYHFHRFASLGLAANLLAVPVMALAVMPLGLVSLLLLPFGLEALALVPMGFAVDAILGVAHAVASWPGSVQMVPMFPAWLLGVLTLCGLFFCLWRGPVRLVGLIGMVGVSATFGLSGPRDRVEIVVSDNGARYAVLDGNGQVALMPGRTDDWTAETWLTAWGIDPQRDRDALSALLRCDGLGCVYPQPEAGPVSFSRSLAALVDDCRRSKIVIARVPTRWHCRQPELVIDRFNLWRQGAHLLRLSASGVEVSTVAEQQGDRPWSRSWQRSNFRGSRFSTWGAAQ